MTRLLDKSTGAIVDVDSDFAKQLVSSGLYTAKLGRKRRSSRSKKAATDTEDTATDTTDDESEDAGDESEENSTEDKE